MPAGPALVARRTGAALIPAVCAVHAPTGCGSSFGEPVAEPRPVGTGLAAMTQQVADFFAARIAEQPEDWHMMQPFFAGRGRDERLASSSLRIGLVCPYSFDTPGGVQNHVLGLARHLPAHGPPAARAGPG